MDLYEIVLGIEKQRIREALTGRHIPWFMCLPALMFGIVLAHTTTMRLWVFSVANGHLSVVPTIYFAGILVAACAVYLGWFFVRRVKRVHYRSTFGLIVWCFGWLILGMMAAAAPPQLLAPTDVTCDIRAKVVSGRLPAQSSVRIDVLEWRCGVEALEKGRFSAKMTVTDADELERGDSFRTRGEFHKPLSADTPGAFDNQKWMKDQGISLEFKRKGIWTHQVWQYDPIVRIDRDHQVLRRKLDRLRMDAHKAIQPYSRYGVLSALALGVSKTLDGDTRASFAELGIAHVLAVSGLHFGLIAAAITWFIGCVIGRMTWVLRRWGRKRATVVVSALVLWLYIFIVGAPVSAQRAMLMMYVCMLGHLCGHKTESLRNLSLAGIIILLLDPLALFSPGFQLSFAAVLGIFYTNERVHLPLKQWFQKHVRHEGRRCWLHNMAVMLAMSVGASIMTAPVTIWHFGQVPLLGLLTNLVAIPYVSFILLPLSLVATLFIHVGNVGVFLGIMAGKAEIWGVGAMVWIADHFPLVSVKLPAHPVVLMVFTAFAGMLIFANRPTIWQRRLRVGIAMSVVVVMLLSIVRPSFWQSNDGIRLTFIAMGQADATLIEFPDGTTMLVDAGNAVGSSYDMGKARIVPYLQYLGIGHLDYIVLTHADYDHYAAIESVVKAMSVGQFWYNGEHAQDPAYLQMMSVLTSRGIPIRSVAEVSQHHQFGDASLVRLWPTTNDVAEDLSRNDKSIVFRLQYGAFSALLMGDAGFEVERKIAAHYGDHLDVTLLKAGHHGSRYATEDAWLRVTAPEFVVFSAGVRNRYQFPAADTVKRCAHAGAKMFGTDRHGTVRMTSDGQHLDIQTAW